MLLACDSPGAEPEELVIAEKELTKEALLMAQVRHELVADRLRHVSATNRVQRDAMLAKWRNVVE